ncbi:MAG: HEAT repeat domain-containing protein [Planctomycetota bacterium]
MQAEATVDEARRLVESLRARALEARIDSVGAVCEILAEPNERAPAEHQGGRYHSLHFTAKTREESSARFGLSSPSSQTLLPAPAKQPYQWESEVEIGRDPRSVRPLFLVLIHAEELGVHVEVQSPIWAEWRRVELRQNAPRRSERDSNESKEQRAGARRKAHDRPSNPSPYTRGERQIRSWVRRFVVLVVFSSIIAGAAYLGSDRLSESWYRWRLDNGGAEARNEAALRLGELRSLGSVPRLLDRLSDGAITEESTIAALRQIGAPARPALIATLVRGRLTLRNFAIEALLEIRGERLAGDTAEQLRRLTLPEARSDAIHHLGSLPEPEHEVVAALCSLVRDPSLADPKLSIRTDAIRVLGSFGRRAQAAVPIISNLLEDSDQHLFASVAFALVRVGAENPPATIRAIADRLDTLDSEDAVSTVLDALAVHSRQCLEIAPQLLNLLRRRETSIDSWTKVLAILEDNGEKASSFIPSLITEVETRPAAFVCRVIQSVTQLSARRQESVDFVTRSLSSPSPEIRNCAEKTLPQFGRAGADALAARIDRYLSKEIEGLPSSTVLACGTLGRFGESLIPQLVELLGTDYGRSSLEALSSLGPVGQAAAPAVYWQLRMRDDEVFLGHGVRTLQNFGEAGLPYLVDLLQSEDDLVSALAAGVLGPLGPLKSDVISYVTKATLFPVLTVRLDAVRSLGEFGSGARTAIPPLSDRLEELESKSDLRSPIERSGDGARRQEIEALRSALERIASSEPTTAAPRGTTIPSPQVRKHLAETERTIRDATTVGALRTLIETSEEPRVRLRSIAKIAKIAPESPASREAYVKALGDERAAVRERACRALGERGLEAKADVQLLVERLKDPEGRVRWTAAHALRRSGPSITLLLPQLVDRLGDSSIQSPDFGYLREILAEQGALALPPLSAQLSKPGSSALRAGVLDVLGHIPLPILKQHEERLSPDRIRRDLKSLEISPVARNNLTAWLESGESEK